MPIIYPSGQEFLTAKEVAAILRVSHDSVMRIFEKRPGVLNMGSPETKAKQQYRVIRIPRLVLDKYIIEVLNH